jgi:hypothetical protein
MQNLISNSSFSDITLKKDSNEFYKILPGILSNLKHWYLPEYINYKKATQHLNSILYSSISYKTSRDNDLVIKKKAYANSNADQMFENNLGFMAVYLNDGYTVSVIQQHLIHPLKPGNYCLKFKYKYLGNHSLVDGKIGLEFSFSPTNLKEYYVKERLTVPLELIQAVFKDSVKETDENTPWQQLCYSIKLNGNEQFLNIGALTNPRKYSFDHASYFIDDIELYYLSDTSKCMCESINKDLRHQYLREFPINKHISNDTLVMFTPHTGWVPEFLSPPAKYYLQNIVSFMQRNPTIKIKFIEHNQQNNMESMPFFYDCFFKYLFFYGISKNRVSVESGLCEDTTSIYCGRNAQYIKIGFEFYNE